MQPDAEAAETIKSNLQRITREITQSAKNIGVPTKDGAALRDRIEKSKQRWQAEESKLKSMMKAASTMADEDGVWSEVKSQHEQERRQFDDAVILVRRKEGEFPLAGSAAAAAAGPSSQAGTSATSLDGGATASSSSIPRAGLQVQRQQQITKLQMAELHTEEQLQREKQQGAIEIAQDVTELKSIYQEFGSMLHEQQPALNQTETNVDQATKHVEKGVSELQSANKYQKSSRKKLCALVIVLVVIVAIVVIVVVVLKAK